MPKREQAGPRRAKPGKRSRKTNAAPEVQALGAQIGAIESADALFKMLRRVTAEVATGALGSRLGDTIANLGRLKLKVLELRVLEVAATKLAEETLVLTPQEVELVMRARAADAPKALAPGEAARPKAAP